MGARKRGSAKQSDTANQRLLKSANRMMKTGQGLKSLGDRALQIIRATGRTKGAVGRSSEGTRLSSAAARELMRRKKK
jgi:hypothetical protein